jgi:hypothetical protein
LGGAVLRAPAALALNPEEVESMASFAFPRPPVNPDLDPAIEAELVHLVDDGEPGLPGYAGWQAE